MKFVSFVYSSLALIATQAVAAPVPSGSGSAMTDSTGTATGPSPSTETTAGSPSDPLNITPKPIIGDSYHMPNVRVVHARVQSDAPAYKEGRFVSSYGKDVKSGYLSAMDSVNTASVEGALMYVQAEGININSRADKDRCTRKNSMNYIVFYEILISQTNETIAQFQDSWSTPEYGPMIPMDSGRCTPLSGDNNFSPGCYQFNGDNKQPNIGPFIGGGLKNDDIRAPYPNTYWFSFPNTCPLQTWATKTTECRAKTRQGLCDLGVAPDGVHCTYAYNILGWVPIDDVVGITSIINPSTNQPYGNFTEWCQADEKNIEFAGDDKTGNMTDGLQFWSDPLNSEANAARAEKVLDTYALLLQYQNSTQVAAKDVANFKPLPSVDSLTQMNPPCYKTVKSCGSGNGCKRVGYSQLCTKCEAGESCATSDGKFTFPTLAKAPTTLSDDETKTNTSTSNKPSGNGDGSKKAGANSGMKITSSALGSIATLLVVMLAF